MKHTFTIVKHIASSRANVVANYLDLEHLPVHAGLKRCRVLSESERAACFEMISMIGPLPIRNVHYFEFRPPAQIFHAVRSPLGPMYVTSTVKEFDSGSPNVRCEVVVETTLELPRVLYPARKLLEQLLRRLNARVLAEDETILERRQKLLGDNIDDYLRPEQFLLFKELFAEHYGPRGGR